MSENKNKPSNENLDGQALKEAPEANAETPVDAAAAPGGKILMPDVSFSTFALSLASSALLCLGEVPDPESGEPKENLPLARHTIDILCMLEEKTKNGLDQDEARLLNGILYELRMKYVMKSK